MHKIEASNVAQALPMGVAHLFLHGVREKTRAGDCLVSPGPVMTVLRKPRERVLFSALRDANPFFHIVESLWMLAGRNDTGILTKYVSDFSKFAETGGVMHGAYGHRWRCRFGIDQLDATVERLRADQGTRQIVLQMWDCTSMRIPVEGVPQELGSVDLTGDWKDRPCNTHAYVRIRKKAVSGDKVLDLTVCCRSNDIVWGLYGANAVHFSVLQEYLAARVGVEIGSLYTLSNNFHMYCDTMERMRKRKQHAEIDESEFLSKLHDDRYQSEDVKTEPMFEYADGIDDDVESFFNWHDYGTPLHTANSWFTRVAQPMVEMHRAFKDKDIVVAMNVMRRVGADDWRVAAEEWIRRRAR